MISAAVHASPNAQSLRNRTVRGVVIGVAATVVLALLGAMNTGQAPLGYRLLYWAAVILPGSLLGVAVQTAVQIWGGLKGRRWAEIIVVATLVSIPHTFLVVVATALFFGIDAITPGVVLFFGLAVLLVALVLTTINHLAAPDRNAIAAVSSVADPLPVPAETEAPMPTRLPALPELIAEKLPSHLRQARLIAIEAEDHYLRIHTDNGSDLVLMRLTDACALLTEAAGMRVHRGWWVARLAVERINRQGGKTELTLAGGLVAPVSRTVHQALRTAGWG